MLLPMAPRAPASPQRGGRSRLRSQGRRESIYIYIYIHIYVCIYIYIYIYIYIHHIYSRGEMPLKIYLRMPVKIHDDL